MEELNMQKAARNEGAGAEIKFSDKDVFARACSRSPVSKTSGVSTRRRWVRGDSLDNLLQAPGVLTGAERQAT